MLLTISSANLNRLLCQWPCCKSSASFSFVGTEALHEHYRSVHDTHEFSWSCLLPCQSTLSHSGAGIAPLTQRIQSGGTATGRRSGQPSSSGVPSTRGVAELGFILKCSESRRRVRFSTPTSSDIPPGSYANHAENDITAPVTKHESQTSFQDTPEQPVKLQKPKLSGWLKFNPGLPPSYWAASRHRFTRNELDRLVRHVTTQLPISPPPLFVYGTFMFPSILRQIARKFTTLEGFYSVANQRRLWPQASDWASMDSSLLQATLQMTPALLSGYHRWKPFGLSCAAISEVSLTPDILASIGPAGEKTQWKTLSGIVEGFLIFGLGEEALRCCDELLSGALLEASFDASRPPTNGGSRYGRFPPSIRSEVGFQRKLVTVALKLKGNKTARLDAITFAWNEHAWNIGNRGLECEWDICEFVKSKSFQKLSSGADNDTSWLREEQALAENLGVTVMLPGDLLSDAVLKGKVDEVIDLLQDIDVNAPCQKFSNVLQAAAYSGNEEIFYLILSYNPDVNARGGEYETALLCATIRGHEGIARSLIKAGANPLGSCGHYISPLYQAVNQCDLSLTRLLLEHGAWVTRDYREILDLAAERGKVEISHLLFDYDVRDLHRKSSATGDSQSESNADTGSEGRGFSEAVERMQRGRLGKLAPKPGAILKAIALQSLMLTRKQGKWTGLKGVRILKAAIDAGLSPEIVDYIAPHLSDITKLIQFLQRAVKDLDSPFLVSGSNASKSLGKISAGLTIIDLPASRHRDSTTPNVRTNSHNFENTEQIHCRRQPPRHTASFADDITSMSGSSQRVTCPTCEGSGHRGGTGSICPVCSSGPQRSRCQYCNGAGLIFSDRDRCRNCDGGRFIHRSIANHSPSIPRNANSIPKYPPPPYSRHDIFGRPPPRNGDPAS
jgi:hypothetical protein